MEIVGFPLIIPVALADPFEAVKTASEHDRGSLYEIEVDGAELADERTVIGRKRAAAALVKSRLSLGRGCVPPDKIHDGGRIVEAVRVMFTSGFRDEQDVAAELAITLRNHSRIFVPGHDFIGVAIDMKQGDLGCRQRSEIVHRIFPLLSLLFPEVRERL